MVTKCKKGKKSGSAKRYIGRPSGKIQERVTRVGADRFAIVSVDCAKQRSKWMICNFLGKVIVEPSIVEHTKGCLAVMIEMVREAFRKEGMIDSIIAIEMTGVYHKPVQRAFRKVGFDTRLVHPFASSHYRDALHPGNKTDDRDLEGIFHASAQGFGLALIENETVYESLKATSRQRNNLVKQRSRLMVQIRRLLHETMPGFADVFDVETFFDKSIAIPIALEFSSAEEIVVCGVERVSSRLSEKKVRCLKTTVEKVVAWARTAPDACETNILYTRHWRQLNQVRELLNEQIVALEREMAEFLVKTPYILLLSVTGINVISAARLAGEAGPIERYPAANSINGRCGLYPSRYQSDEVDRADGPLVRQSNRQLRAAALQMADNLIKCNPYYRGLSALWTQQKIDPRDRHCRIANRAMRMVYQLVGGKQVWRGQAANRENVLDKLRQFHHEHQTPIDQTVQALHEAFKWLPETVYSEEGKPLLEIAVKKRGTTPIGELLVELFIRLGIGLEEIVESTTSEARSSS